MFNNKFAIQLKHLHIISFLTCCIMKTGISSNIVRFRRPIFSLIYPASLSFQSTLSKTRSYSSEKHTDELLMAAIAKQDDDNVFKRWSVEEDTILYQGHKNGVPLEELCITLKRGFQGVKARLKHINNPDHKAYLRLFGTTMNKSYGILDVDINKPLTSVYLRPCGEVIGRILWDPSLDLKDFSFIYSDRYNGLIEMPANSKNTNVKGSEKMLIKAIPEHRIEIIKYVSN